MTTLACIHWRDNETGDEGHGGELPLAMAQYLCGEAIKAFGRHATYWVVPIPVMTRVIVHEHLTLCLETNLVWSRRGCAPRRWGSIDSRKSYRELPTRVLKQEWRELRDEAYRVRARAEVGHG